MKKKTLLMVGLLSLNLSATADTLTFPEGDVHASHTLGKVMVTHDGDGYAIVKEDGSSQSVLSHNVDASIRNLTSDQLSKAFGKLYLTVTGDESEPVIHSAVRGLGGGPGLAAAGASNGIGIGAGIGAFAGPVGVAVGSVVGGVVGGVIGFFAGPL